MKTQIQIYEDLKKVVSFFSRQLRFDKYKNKTGRKLALDLEEIISLALFKQKNNIATKKALFEIFSPDCSYKTLVVNLNRWLFLAVIVLVVIMKMNKKDQHSIKHIDSTDIPVCLLKNANTHKTMKGLASYGRSSKGTFFGLKLHLVSDLERKILSFCFSSGEVDDRRVVIEMTDEIRGILVADAGYVSKKLEKEFFKENERIMLIKPRNNMKRIMTKFQSLLYDTRMLIELNFRSLKMFFGLVTSLPRSVDGYFANYIYALLAYQIA